MQTATRTQQQPPKWNIVLADAEQYELIRRNAPERLPLTIQIDTLNAQIPSIVTCAAGIEIKAGNLTALPTWLRELPSLRYLSIPIHLHPSLYFDLLPTGLETLEMTGDHNANLDGFVHEGIKRIVALYGVINFSPSVFPAIRHFHARSDKKQTVLRQLASAGIELTSATVSPFSSTEKLNVLLENRLEYLRLIGGQATTLEGLSRFRRLTDLDLHDLPKLEYIDELQRLPSLQEICIGYCNKVRDLTTVKKIASLRRLSLYGCKKLLAAVDTNEIAQIGLETLSL
jgi:hypothetical protein